MNKFPESKFFGFNSVKSFRNAELINNIDYFSV